MEQNPEICRRLIEIILQIKVAWISYPELEKTIDARIDSKSVCLDVYAEGDDNRSFDLEMQVSNTHDLLKRTRYKMLRYGKSFEEIHQLTELPLQRIQELAKTEN